tara:strand:+ start:489 stop:848 length:360 start_codon:yes stop_codon:yes gene_type:complete
MKEEWLFPNAIVPVDVETTAALVAEIHRLIGVVGGMALAQPEQEPVCPECKAVVLYECVACSSNNYPPQRKPLTDEQIFACENSVPDEIVSDRDWCIHFARAIEQALKEKNICQDQNQK